MADKYGGLVFPVPELPAPGSFPVDFAIGDVLLGYVADYVRTILTTYVEDAWKSVAPGYSKIVKTIILNEPTTSINEEWLPALYVYRPGRETRETVETFEQIADDYRYQIGRISLQWVMPAAPQEHRLVRNNIIDSVRKTIDAAIQIGRDPAWIVPGDTDPLGSHYDAKAATFGSSLSSYAGFATLELQHASPASIVRKMEPPAKDRSYESLKMSLYCEELLQRDLDLIGAPHTSNKATYQSPDQGTGLGDYTLGEAEYD